MKRRVLDIGQCDADHSRIGAMLNSHFEVKIDRAHTLKEAVQLTGENKYDLVMINRLLDIDGSAGMDVLEMLKKDGEQASAPIMIVSNFEDAQKQAVANGAVQGFGKAAVTDAETVALVGQYLHD